MKIYIVYEYWGGVCNEKKTLCKVFLSEDKADSYSKEMNEKNPYEDISYFVDEEEVIE